MAHSVNARLEPFTLPTYPVGQPERNPLFFERRVYQGSCGKVYPVPFIDKVYDEPRPVTYSAAFLENEYIRLVLLPEIGGRVLIGQDKSNGDFDFLYRQDVIKPALVGLAGPWISGGIEFNWPQHHRPGTFLPADVFIEEEPDGARTVWLSEHDPISHLKGMHGFRLRPGSALIEIRVRLFNRTPLVQSFLWWTNIAARVHERYQSFFPPDVRYVADHAVRAQSSFPIASNPYYGVRYQDRHGANDLTWYKNIPVPTSYMVCDTKHDFFGGYDHEAQGGFVHVANRHISPGKKQWTWGNHAFGHAWDRELTDAGGPYIELMAGVYTDNQPDFSYLAPGETRAFSQFIWPVQQIGPLQAANERAGLRLIIGDDDRLEIGATAPVPLDGARIVVREGTRIVFERKIDLRPGAPFLDSLSYVRTDAADALVLELVDAGGKRILEFRPPVAAQGGPRRPVAKEPPAPRDVSSGDELYFFGEHLEKYRHPTREPEPYWKEALRRDPGDSRAHLALGKRLLSRGLLEPAAHHLEAAIARLTVCSRNPVTGEAHYHLGLVRRMQDRLEEAHALFFKATWDHAWRAAAFHELALIACRRGELASALEHLESSLDTNRQNNRALVVRAAILRRLDRREDAVAAISALLVRDPLDHWARYEEAVLSGDFARFLQLSRNDAQTALDLAFDYADAGLLEEACGLLERHHEQAVTPVAVPNPLGRSPSTHYALAWLLARSARPSAEIVPVLVAARGQSSDHFFPSRLHEQFVLEWAVAQPGSDPLAGYGLGNLFFDRKRHEEAIAVWEHCIAADAGFTTAHRNLGIALWNLRRDGGRARAAYERALALDPSDARLLYEFDQLRKKLNEAAGDRLALLESRRDQVLQRDDASVELAALYNLLARPHDALALLGSRRFHPWEGGEGRVLRQYTAACLRIGELALEAGDAACALGHFSRALETPANLGEAYHLLQAKADVNYCKGRALRALGRETEAVCHFELSAAESGDFADMAVAAHSPLSLFRGLALRELGREDEAKELFRSLIAYAQGQQSRPAKIDYFATSLPNLLVFDEDIQARRDADLSLLLASGHFGLGEFEQARGHMEHLLAYDASDLHAAFLARQLENRATPV